MKIKPVGNQLLVRVDEIEEVSEGGIVYAKQYRDREQGGCVSGVVVGMGSLAFADFDHDLCGIGDRVVFERYAGFTPHMKDMSDENAIKWRLMLDTEIRAVAAEDGVDLNER